MIKQMGLIIFCILTISGCGGRSENDLHPEKTYRIVEIDGHEYIFISRRPWSAEMAITHKANCKYPHEPNR